jgi:PPOX class probable F420-dependent enzyme
VPPAGLAFTGFERFDDRAAPRRAQWRERQSSHARAGVIDYLRAHAQDEQARVAGVRRRRDPHREDRDRPGRRLPHVTPVWFVLNETGDGDELIFNTGVESVKGKALRRAPRISLAVDDEQPPYAFVQFTAEASLHEDLDEMLSWATKIGTRYMGAEQGAQFGKRNAVPGEYLVRAKITNVVALAGLTD